MADLDLSGSLSKANVEAEAAAEAISDLTKAMKNAVVEANKYDSVSNEIKKRTTSIRNSLDDTLKIMAKQGNERLKEKDITARINENIGRRAQIIAQIRKALAEQRSFTVTTDIKEVNANKLILDSLDKQLDITRGIDKELNNVRNNIDKWNAALEKSNSEGKMLEKLFRSISKIPFFGQLINFKLIADEVASAEGGFKKIGVAIGSTFREVGKAAFSTLGAFAIVSGIIINLVKSALKLDETITNVSNNMGMSAKGANALFQTMSETSYQGSKLASALDQSFLSVTNQAQALLNLQEAFSTNAMLSDQMLQDNILLTKQMGLEGDQAAGIAKYYMLSGKTATEILNNVTKTNTANISNKKIISEIAKINAEISASYKNNPELIASAVVQAEKLGLSLEQTRKISESLLDFESSISNELEAELLSGQQLNFEKARSLALDGKSAEAAAELVRQMGGLNKLTNMNVIVRGSMAKSIGMTSEELMKAAQQQEILNSLGAANIEELEKRYDLLINQGKTNEAAALMADIQKQKNGEILAQDISRASLNKRFEESMNRVKEIFVTIASGPILSMLDSFAKLISEGNAIKGIFNAVKAAAAVAAAAFLIINPIGAGVMLATLAAGGLAYSATVEDSAIAPSGQIMISTPKGMIKPDPQDSIITTTDPGSLLSGGGGSSSGVESRLDQLLSVMSKGGNVYIDSVRSGTAYGMSYNSYA